MLAVVKKPRQEKVEMLIKKGGSRLLMLYQINNPNNLGALLRTAHWFGFETVMLSAGSVDFTHPKVVRSSMGSIFHINMADELDFIETTALIKKDFFVVGSHAKKGVRPHPCAGKTALMLGSESHGIPEALLGISDELWSIPGSGDADSLSLPQAAAIMMYECASPGRGNPKEL